MTNKAQNFDKGRFGESMAKKYLEDKGYVWVESNHVNYLGEIDLIFTRGKYIVFVEVKLKIGNNFGTPEEMISKGKLSRVTRIAQAFLVLNPQYATFMPRIEAVCIVLNEDKTINRIAHYDQF